MKADMPPSDRKTSMKSVLLTCLLGFICVLSLCCTTIAVQYLDGTIPSFQLSIYRTLGTTVIFGIFICRERNWDIIWTWKKEWLILVSIGFTSTFVVVNQYAAVLFIPIGSSCSALNAVLVVFSFLIGRIAFHEKLGCIEFVSATLSITGGIIVTYFVLIGSYNGGLNLNMKGNGSEFTNNQHLYNLTEIEFSRNRSESERYDEQVEQFDENEIKEKLMFEHHSLKTSEMGNNSDSYNGNASQLSLVARKQLNFNISADEDTDNWNYALKGLLLAIFAGGIKGINMYLIILAAEYEIPFKWIMFGDQVCSNVVVQYIIIIMIM